VEAIERMHLLTHLKEAQHLTRCMTALGRFISNLGEFDLPLFKILKKVGHFEWTGEAEQAFSELKKYLSSPPVLVVSRDKEELLLYISANPQVISAVLVDEREDEDHAQIDLGPRMVNPGPGAAMTNPEIAGSSLQAETVYLGVTPELPQCHPGACNIQFTLSVRCSGM
jgi:hypothetical protein